MEKSKVEIRHKVTRSVIFSYEEEDNSLKKTLEEAAKESISLKNANLSGERFRGEGHSGESLIKADLRGIDLSYAIINGMDFREVKLRGANLEGAYFEGTNFNGADLSGANFERTNLKATNLKNSDLSCTNLRLSTLEGANLEGANLRWTKFIDTCLTGANLKGANIDFASLTLSCGDLKTGYDEKQIIQKLYHVLSCCMHSKNVSKEFKESILTKEYIKIANEFHRAEECGKLKL